MCLCIDMYDNRVSLFCQFKLTKKKTNKKTLCMCMCTGVTLSRMNAIIRLWNSDFQTTHRHRETKKKSTQQQQQKTYNCVLKDYDSARLWLLLMHNMSWFKPENVQWRQSFVKTCFGIVFCVTISPMLFHVDHGTLRKKWFSNWGRLLDDFQSLKPSNYLSSFIEWLFITQG